MPPEVDKGLICSFANGIVHMMCTSVLCIQCMITSHRAQILINVYVFTFLYHKSRFFYIIAVEFDIFCCGPSALTSSSQLLRKLAVVVRLDVLFQEQHVGV